MELRKSLEMDKFDNECKKENKIECKKIREYRSTEYDVERNEHIETGEYCSSYPIVLKSDGTVWDKASLYIDFLRSDRNRSSALLRTAGNDLLDFLRFMEANNLNMLHLPIKKAQRVTFRYRHDLLEREKEFKPNGHKKIGRNTISQRINRIVDFYEFCIENKIFTFTELDNRPYTLLKKRIYFEDEKGFTQKKVVRSSDLSIPRAPRAIQTSDSIKDGRKLHPLTEQEQSIFISYLKASNNRVLQLICLIALTTGARIQSICTLRVNDIKNMMISKKEKGSFKKIEIGGGESIDNKNDKKYIIFFHTELLEMLNNYINSEEWKERSTQSYYKNKNNYIFLTKFGEPFYTSRKELEDRKNRLFPVSKPFSEKDGKAVYKNMKDLFQKMENDKQLIRKFSIHDLRATFGLNLVHLLQKYGVPESHIIEEVRERMGHKDRETTYLYLNYSAKNKFYESVKQEFVELIYCFN